MAIAAAITIAPGAVVHALIQKSGRYASDNDSKVLGSISNVTSIKGNSQV
jgi:hypothetical protein